jgi:hypothetical protein
MKASKRATKVFAGVISTSILTASCTQYLPGEDYVYGNIITNDSDLGEIAIPISIKLKPEDVQYINAIQKITTEIIDSPQKAKEFNKNPSYFLKKYGYGGKINFDETVLKITMAFADEEINNAIKNNDLKLFYYLCSKKEIITPSSKSIFSDEYYKAQFEDILENEKMVAFEDDFVLGFFAVLAAAVVVFAGIGFVLIFLTKGKGPNSSELSDSNLGIFDVYALRAGMENTHVAVSQYVEDEVNEAISLIKEIQPDYLNHVSEMELINFLKINIVNNLAK